MIQYAAAVRYNLQSRGVLDTPPARGMTITSRRVDFLALLAEALDAERDHIADFEEFRGRLHAGADAGRRTCGDDVAGQQGEECRDVGNALRHREDHGRGRAG